MYVCVNVFMYLCVCALGVYVFVLTYLCVVLRACLCDCMYMLCVYALYFPLFTFETPYRQ